MFFGDFKQHILREGFVAGPHFIISDVREDFCTVNGRRTSKNEKFLLVSYKLFEVLTYEAEGRVGANYVRFLQKFNALFRAKITVSLQG